MKKREDMSGGSYRPFPPQKGADAERRRPVYVIGLGLSGGPPENFKAEIIDRAQTLAGGCRILEKYAGHPAEKIVLGKKLEGALAAIESHRDSGRLVVVLAGGDPLFFGIGATLAKRLGREAVRVLPALSCLQEACSRLSLPWDKIRAVSLHGRGDMRPLTGAVREGGDICVLTDAANSPDHIARFLLERGLDCFKMHVFENMGPGERHSSLALREAADMSFEPCNTVVLQRDAAWRRPSFGIEDAGFAAESGLITKAPVRAAALAMLAIQPCDTIWDVGAGSGAVSIEAAALAGCGLVFAVEREPARIELIVENRRRFSAVNVEIVPGIAPGCLEALPGPDRVFLGGGLAKNGEALLKALMRALNPGGRLLVSCVLQKSLHLSLRVFSESGWRYELASIQAAQSVPLASDIYLAACNPVFLALAHKPGAN